MAERKTIKTEASVAEYIGSLPSVENRSDCQILLEMMESICTTKAKMWGSSIVGVGDHGYTNSAGKWVDWFLLGFSSRKAAISIYGGACLQLESKLLQELGSHSMGVGCLYVKRLADVDLRILERLLRATVKAQKEMLTDQRSHDKARASKADKASSTKSVKKAVALKKSSSAPVVRASTNTSSSRPRSSAKKSSASLRTSTKSQGSGTKKTAR